MMALYRREKSGKGDYLDMSMTDSLISWTPHILSEVIVNNTAPNLSRERLYGGAAFYNIYETSDGRRLVFSGSEMTFAENLLNALERPDLIPLCEKPWGDAQKPVKEFLRKTFLTKTLSQWDEWFSDRSVCWAPVLELDEAWRQKFLRDRGIVSKGRDGVERVGTPVCFLNEPATPSDKLPSVGEDTQQVLRQVGYDSNDYKRLIENGVC
jgi:crotonobetainyl-CoA:carnitine CoA-transferase CaiB-like acyl-CoA transferase